MVKIEPVGLRPEDAAAFIGVSRNVLDRCDRAGWVKPAIRQHKLVIYRPGSLVLLLNRIEKEGLPPLENGTRDQCPASQEEV